MAKAVKAEAPSVKKAEVRKPKANKKGAKQVAAVGQAHITATYNNTILTLTDQTGDTITWASAGKMGFRGPKKATAFAAGIIVRDAVSRAMDMGLREVDVFVKGVGAGREAAVRSLNANGLNVASIKDVTPIPHNGPRPRKPRRV